MEISLVSGMFYLIKIENSDISGRLDMPRIMAKYFYICKKFIISRKEK